MKNEQLIQKFRLMAQLLEIRGENPFKTKAYTNAADAIESLEEEVSVLVSENRFHAIKGIGATMRDHVLAMLSTGSFQALQEMLEVTPSGVIELLRIKGLGPKKVAQLWLSLHITSPGELLHACQENRLMRAKGFGEKSQAQIQKAVEFYSANIGKLHYAKAYPVLEFWHRHLQKYWQKVEPTGSVRRKMPVIEEIEFVVSGTLPTELKLLALKSIENQFDLYQIQHETECPILIYHTKPERFYSILCETTCWGEHLNFLKPYLHTEYSSEEEIYEAAGLQWITPEFRENQGEIELAKTHSIQEFITIPQIRGLIHAHSTDSDGLHTVEEMAVAAQKAGLEYMVITDHSQTAFYANGLTPGRIEVQHQVIDKLNQQQNGFRIYKGIESDILADGSLDYTEDILKTFDFVIASIHSQFQMTEAEATARIIKAIENPYTTMLGHLTGRLLLFREGYPVNHKKILEACAANAVAIEINSHPYRLDLDWKWIRYATELGILLSINPDAHAKNEIENIRWGVEVARKGGLTASQTLNSFSVPAFEAWLRNRKH